MLFRSRDVHSSQHGTSFYEDVDTKTFQSASTRFNTDQRAAGKKAVADVDTNKDNPLHLRYAELDKQMNDLLAESQKALTGGDKTKHDELFAQANHISEKMDNLARNVAVMKQWK